MTYTQWLESEYRNTPELMASHYHNHLHWAFVCNISAPEPVWTNHLCYPMPGFQHLDQAYNSWPAQPTRDTPPSFLQNEPPDLPPYTVCFLNSMGFPMRSFCLDVWTGLEEPSEALIKPRRSYWTGIPQKRRNLPAA